jgi:hypothetical protein
MILLLAALLQEPSPLSLEPFRNEKAAGIALEEHLTCLGHGAFKHRRDPREVKLVAADVVKACGERASRLRRALSDVYRRKPAVMSSANSPQAAADEYVEAMNNRTELVISQGRKRGQHAPN